MKTCYVFRFLLMGVCFLILGNVFIFHVEAAFTEPALIVHKEIQDDKVTAFIPQISGLSDKMTEESLNHILRKDVEHDINKFLHNWDTMLEHTPEHVKKSIHFWATYAVKLNKNGLLSVTITEYVYTGGAHGNTAVLAYVMNVATGQVYNLQDIFRPGENYCAQLEKIIRDEISTRDPKAYWFKGLEQSPSFYLIEEGLVVYFQPYEIGPWSTGVPRFVIPYSKLSKLNPELPLY